MAIAQHKYLFSKTGRPLKLNRKVKEKRIFPSSYSGVVDYVNKYFDSNPYFVRNDYGY